MPARTIAACDLGATSGRVLLAAVDASAGRLQLDVVHRFDNRPVYYHGALHWDAPRLYADVLTGLDAIRTRTPTLDSVGVCTWGVDYALLGEDGTLLDNPYHYRDTRTDGVMDEVVQTLGRDVLYDRTGIQFLPFNTLYQLVAAARRTPQLLRQAETLLTWPDLLNFWLTGRRVCEFTNATTTQMLDWRTKRWATDLLEALHLPTHLLADVVAPGTDLGEPRADVASVHPVLRGTRVIAPACHDTGSAVAAVACDGETAFLSSGTWSLLGMEVDRAHVTPESLAANVTNEGGVAGTYRLLRNITGLWLLEGCLQAWRAEDHDVDLTPLLEAAADEPAGRTLLNPDAPAFHREPSPAAVAAYARDTRQPVADSPAAVTRAVLDSLALAYRRTLLQLEGITGRHVTTIRVMGGGARNAVLNQLTADVTGRVVLAGPAEATAMGNVLVQLVALGDVRSIAEARALAEHAQPPVRYEPTGADWRDAIDRFETLVSGTR
jgi:rhamnulokinase